MTDNNIEELARLAAIYAEAGTTNPIIALRVSTGLSQEDQALLRLIIERSPSEEARRWRHEAQGQQPEPGNVRPLSKEECLNLAQRDVAKVSKTALLDFLAHERKRS